MIVIDVLGTPAPKGSNRAVRNRWTGAAMLIPGGSKVNERKLKTWAQAVTDAALDASSTTMEAKPVAVAIVFRLARPAGHWSKRGTLKPSAPTRPSVKPDVDKLARATLDALTGVVFDDDSRIVELALHKTYAVPGQEGARIVVKEWKP